MRIEYDAEHDLLNIVFLPDALIAESTEMDGIIVDYTAEQPRRIVSIEILDASKRTSPDPFALLDVAFVRPAPTAPTGG